VVITIMGEVKSFQVHEGGIGMSFTKDPFNGLFFIDYDPAPETQVRPEQEMKEPKDAFFYRESRVMPTSEMHSRRRRSRACSDLDVYIFP
jgi:hypothetical protein